MVVTWWIVAFWRSVYLIWGQPLVLVKRLQSCVFDEYRIWTPLEGLPIDYATLHTLTAMFAGQAKQAQAIKGMLLSKIQNSFCMRKHHTKENSNTGGNVLCCEFVMRLKINTIIFTLLSLKVLNFWKFSSYWSLKPLWSGMGEVVPARTSLTLHPPSPPTVHQLSRLALEELT